MLLPSQALFTDFRQPEVAQLRLPATIEQDLAWDEGSPLKGGLKWRRFRHGTQSVGILLGKLWRCFALRASGSETLALRNTRDM